MRTLNQILFVSGSVLLSTAAMGQSQSYAIQDSRDYSTRALREGHQGAVTFHLVIGEQGKPESCDIIKSSGWPELDNKTCELALQRAKFTPGKDEDGNPVMSDYTGNMRWVIPDQQPVPVSMPTR